MLLWSIILIVLLCGIALAFSGIWRVGSASPADIDYDRALYQASISEIESDFDMGRIDEASRDAALAEQARKLLREAGSTGTTDTISPSRTFVLIVMAMVFVPAFSLVVYSGLDTPAFVQKPAPAPSAINQATFEELLAAAENQLAKNPDDIRGWRVVAPVYMRTGQFEKAVNAFRQMLELEEGNMDTMRGLGEALVLRDENRINDEAFGLFKAIVQEAPNDTRSWYFIGLGERQRGNVDAARKIWETLRDSAKGDEVWLPVVLQRLRELSPDVSGAPAFSEEQREQINAMVSGLAEKLKENPDNKPGFERLLRSYLVLNREDDARELLEQAQTRFADDQEFVSKLEAMMGSQAVSGEEQ